MSTVTIELPEEIVLLAAERAGKAHLPVAEWLSLRIAGRRGLRATEGFDAMGYPSGWFERTTGSLADVDDFCEPADRPEVPSFPLEL